MPHEVRGRIDASGRRVAVVASRFNEVVTKRLVEGAVARVIEANPDAVASYRSGDAKSLNFLMGQVMKQTQGKANPAQVRELLLQKLA